MKNKLFIIFSGTARFEECDYRFKLAIREAIKKTLNYEDFPYDAEVSVTVCDNEYIKRLNSAYRNKDASTDVLSFPMYDFYSEDIDEPLDEPVPLGDIVLNIERAREQAKEIGNSFIMEAAFLTIHSTLHLLGYDHERSEEDEEAQCAAQRDIVKTLEI